MNHLANKEIRVLLQLLDHNYAHEPPLQLSDHDYAHKSPIVEIEQPETYIMLPGVRQNSTIYVDNVGFKYYKRRTSMNAIALLCERIKNTRHPKCPGTASISVDMMDNRITIHNEHNHQPEEIDLHVPILRGAISERGLDLTNKTESVRSIYNNEVIEHPEGARNYTQIQAARRIFQMRSLRRHKIKYPCPRRDIEQSTIS